MANLRNFIWSGTYDGMPVNIYLNRTPQIGRGVVEVAQPLRLVVTGEVDLLGSHSGTVEVAMPDESASGTCTVVLNGAAHTDCAYHTDGGYLKIQAAGRELTLGAADKQWTWVGVSGVPGWIGLWPASEVMAEGEAERELAARTIGIDIVLTNATDDTITLTATAVEPNNYEIPPHFPSSLGKLTLGKTHAEALYYRKTVPIKIRIDDDLSFTYDPYNPTTAAGSVERGDGTFGYVCFQTEGYNFQLVVWATKYSQT
jgi:hypothetical protein